MTATAKIELVDVSKSFPNREQAGNGTTASAGTFLALDRINLSIRSGEFATIVGPSGCGKSTLLDLIGGLSRPTSGDIYLDGSRIVGAALDRGIVFQQYALLPWYTALQNVAFGLEIKGVKKAERLAIARRYLALVGLSAFADRYPHELSGGMRQRVAIARSLAHDPAVLLMDEPFAALDAQTRETLQAELLRIWEQSGKTVVFITHSLDEAVYLGQRVVVMAAQPGRIRAIVDVPLSHRRDGDIRSSSAFADLRHQVWELLHQPAARAEDAPAAFAP